MIVDKFWKHKNMKDVAIYVGRVIMNHEEVLVEGTWYNIAGSKALSCCYPIDGSTEVISIKPIDFQDWSEYVGPENAVESAVAKNLAEGRLQRSTTNASPDSEGSRQR